MNMDVLNRGYAKWMWVLEQDANGWLVSDWGGNEERYSAREYSATPDLEWFRGQRVPVTRRIGSGKMAQHFRFERKAAA